MATRAKAEIRERFLAQMTQLIAYANLDAQGMLNLQPNVFYAPDPGEWDGDFSKLEEMSKAFSREEIHEDFRRTVTEGGVTTDLGVETLQGDWLAAMERAYRSRHHSSVRARCHAAARRRGHADSNGVLSKGVLGYLEHLLRMGRS